MADDRTSDWGPALEDLAARRRAARSMGGAERLARQRATGRHDARTRLDLLVDAGSFSEIGTLAGGEVPADGLVAGSGTIDGRSVMVGAEDFTVMGGTIGPASHAKRGRLAELALRDRMPLIMLLEGAGYRATGGQHARGPVDLVLQARCSGQVPLLTAVMGASAGHGALVAPMSDFTVMTRQASIFTAGPPVVRESIGEEVTKEELGGPAIAIKSGLVHNLAADDEAALGQIRRYLSYFPQSAWSYPAPLASAADRHRRSVEGLLEVIPRDPRRVYDIRDVLSLVFDEGRWFEIGSGFGPSLICALARLGGESVAVVANQPLVLAGSVDASGADKAAHFISVADAFHLPLVFLADNPGVLPGSSSEREGILRRGARMFAAQTLARVPKLHVTLRKAYGFGSLVMAMVAFDDQSATFALPGATLGAMGAGAAARASGAGDEDAAAIRQAELEASFRSASQLGFDEIVHPAELRNALLVSLHRALGRRQQPALPAQRSAVTP